MSWTYSGDPSASELDKCRFLVGDTDITDQLMQDGEITYLIANYSGNYLYQQLFEAATRTLTKRIKRSLGPQSEDPTTRLTYYSEQSLHYKKLAACSGLSLQKQAYPKIFHKGMQNNPPYGGDEGYA